MKNIFKIVLCFILGMFVLCGCDQSNVSPPVSHTQPEETKSHDKKSTKSNEKEIFEDDKPSPDSQSSETSGNKTKNEKDTYANNATESTGKIIVLDPGHGKSSSLMSDQEKAESGYTYVQGKGWGEWRHFKSGTMWQDCNGSGCSGRAPQNGSCWYPIGASDRDTEPDINYNNAINAKKYLEQMGYIVRLTRDQNGSPSITERIKNCYPNKDISSEPDAAAFVCIHSNAGGGSGSCFISLSGLYDQGAIDSGYIEKGNSLGQAINNSITQNTSMPKWGTGVYMDYPELVLFCKSPVPVAYLEIGFFDNPADLSILQNESDAIGKAIAQGIDSYYKNKYLSKR